jgi:predicted transcriptional regulator
MTGLDPTRETSAEAPLVDPPDLETVLQAVFGLKTSESRAYLGLLRVPDSSAAEVARELGRDRSNVNRSLRTLRERGLAERRRVLLEDGGHVYRYTPTPLPEAREQMHATLAEWSEAAHDRIDEFGADIDQPPVEARRGSEVYASSAED